jgi:hypothetical protein
MIVIYAKSLTVCINYNDRLLWFFIIGISLNDFDCDWLRLMVYNEEKNGVWNIFWIDDGDYDDWYWY